MKRKNEVPFYTSNSKPGIELYEDFFTIRKSNSIIGNPTVRFEYSEVHKIFFMKNNKRNWWHSILIFILVVLTFSYSPEYNDDNSSIKIYENRSSIMKLYQFRIKGNC